MSCAVEHGIPSQIPIITLVQPLFPLTKQIHWMKFIENRYVIILGGPHIQMATFKMLGKWLSCGGWAEALSHVGVATKAWLIHSFRYII